MWRLKLLAASLKRHGQYNDIVVDKEDNFVEDGEARCRAAELLGWKSLRVRYA